MNNPNPLLVTSNHFETLLEGARPEYESDLPGANPAVTRSYVVTQGVVSLGFPAGTVFEAIAAVGNAPAHTRAVIHGVHVILPQGVEPWTGDRTVSFELRVNTVEPKNITRRCFRNYRLVLDNVRPVSGNSNGRMIVEAARNANVTVIRDGLLIHNGGCLKFPTTGDIIDTSKPRGHRPNQGFAESEGW